ncbi:MAG: hypothetical protein V4651_00820 [Bacteroidota bacterium]
MKLPFAVLVIVILFTGCKKDNPIAIYPKTFTQRSIEHSYVFKVHDEIVSPAPSIEDFFSTEYLSDAFQELSFTLINSDTLCLKYLNYNDVRYLAYIIRNDTLFLKLEISTGEFTRTTKLDPFALGNLAQFEMIETNFSSTPVPLQEKYLAYPFATKESITYKDYSFFSDTAALLTTKRVFN